MLFVVVTLIISIFVGVCEMMMDDPAANIMDCDRDSHSLQDF